MKRPNSWFLEISPNANRNGDFTATWLNNVTEGLSYAIVGNMSESWLYNTDLDDDFHSHKLKRLTHL